MTTSSQINSTNMMAPLSRNFKTDTLRQRMQGRERDAAIWKIELHCLDTDPTTVLPLLVNSLLTIGRSDPDAGYIPDLDLTQFNGLDRGVSRNHARIFAVNRGLYIADRGSKNGTSVNGYHLPANEPFKLSQGDRIEVGKINFVLHFLQMQP